MDINQSSLSRYKSNKSGVSRSISEAKSISENAKLKESSAAAINQKLPDFKEGQIVKGEIIDHRYNEVRIQLEPGKQVVTAKLAGDVPLSIGQNANFQVTEGASDHLVLKYLPSKTTAPADSTVQKALSASNLAMTDTNKAIVSELLSNRMPVDVQTLQTLIKLSHINREASPLSLVLMYKNNIPITKENIQQFEAYQNGTNKLIGDIASLTKQLTKLLLEPGDSLSNSSVNHGKNISMNQGQQDQGGALAGNVDLSKAESTNALQPNVMINSQDNLSQAIQINGKLIEILYRNGNSKNLPNELQGTTISNFLSSDELKALGKSIEQTIADGSPLPAGTPSDIVEQIKSGTLSTEETIKLFTSLTPQSDNTTPIIAKLLNQFTTLQDNQSPLAEILKPAERTALLESMEPFTDTAEIKNQIDHGSASLKKVLTFIQKSLTGTENQAAAKLFQTPEYNKLLEGAFLQKWTLTPEKIAQKAPVQALYQNLQEDIESISHLTKISQGNSEALQIQEPLKNLQENLKFMKDLNEVYTYLQLPVQLKDRQLHSELYVFTNKKALREKSDRISVLLHLDMSNLGSLNIHIQMKQNSIQAKFFTEEKEAGQIIEKNIPLLEEALKRKGYQLHAELLDSYEKPDFSKDFIEQSAAEKSIKRYTFDIRT